MSHKPPQSDFERAAQEKPAGLVRDLIGLLKANKKWWLAPIILALLLIGLLVFLAATKVAPFIYPLF